MPDDGMLGLIGAIALASRSARHLGSSLRSMPKADQQKAAKVALRASRKR